MIAVISDTHMPKGGRRLPDRCLRLVAEAEATIHAGDFFAAEIHEELRQACAVLHAVHGNVDEPALRQALPETTEIELGEQRIAVIHDAGPASGRLARMRARFPGADAVVFGHSHLPLHESKGDFQIFNPGSPTERRRAPRHSMGLLDYGEGRLSFRHVWL